MSIITWVGMFKVITSQFTNKEIKTCIKFGCHLCVNVANPQLLFNHEVSHMCPMGAVEAISEREAKKNAEESRDLGAMN